MVMTSKTAKLLQMPLLPNEPNTFTTNDRELLIRAAITLENVEKSVGELKNTHEQRAAAIEAKIAANASSIETKLGGIETRTRSLENFKWYMSGMIAAAGGAGFFVGKLFGH